MNSFYKGGSELSTDTGSSYSTHIKSDSKKTILVAIQILFRLYFTYIFQGLARYASGFFCKCTGLILKKVSLLASYFLPVNTCLSSAFYAPASVFSSEFHTAVPKPPRSGLEEKPTKGRSWLGVGRVMLYCIAFVSMFSLSAQTPRKDSGVEGPTSLSIGDKVRETFWTQKHLFFIDGDTIRANLSQLQGKLLVLDFWSTTCASCIFQQEEIDFFKKSFANDIAVLMVNPLKTKDSYDRIQIFYKRYYKDKPGKQLNSIILDASLQNMFQFMGYPHYVWINKHGYVQTQTFRNLLDRNYVAPFIDIEP
ncbi:TlpA disulfide reductase family protein [Sphingobacterium sp.]|uniref:TlpA family protein disulfide reductase n=1 Tax=Sphingobacterium sp. TaxID=341027 RepID=UPI0031D5C301